MRAVTKTRSPKREEEKIVKHFLRCLLPIVSASLTLHAQIPNFQHIVVIVQENRTPDNLFQGLCSPPYGSADSCSATPASATAASAATKYDIQTRNWLDKTS